MSGTSNISLRQFVHIAKQDGEGDVRLSRDEDRLVNKGSLGQKIATFFTNIGQALGLIGDEGRQDRQQEALEGFRKSLRDMYGSDIAKTAMLDNELPLYGEGKLTGAKILGVVDRARELRDEQISRGRGMVENMIAEKKDDYDRLIMGAREELEKTKYPLSEKNEQEFMQRLQDRCLRESDLYGEELSPGKVLSFAEEEMQTLVDELKSSFRTTRLNEKDIEESSRRLLEGGLTPEQTQKAFDDINKAMARLRIDGISNLKTPDDYRKFSQGFFARELSNLMKNEDGTINESKLKDLGKVQGELLKPGSVLSQNYRDPKEYSYRDKENMKNKLTDKDFAQSVVEGMVSAMARIMGPVTDSLDGDLSRIRGGAKQDPPSEDMI
jgi:hypothetical protein